MKFIEWYPYYLKILLELKLNLRKDFLSSLLLSNLISKTTFNLNDFKIINNKKILIIGAGPSIEEQLVQNFIKKHNDFIVISADGSTELCLKIGVVPDFVLTDLDGDIESLISANKLGSILLIHAHGDNIAKILKYVPKFKNCYGTTQVFPHYNIYNFGGFTDGDRCAFFADEFHAAEIWLVGMDFTSSIGYFSKKMKNIFSLKKKKLYIGKRLIEMLVRYSNSTFYNVTTFKFNSALYGVVDYKLK